MGRVIIKIVGSGAGGGFPQWNCNGPVSRRAWAGEPVARPRTQASVAVSSDGEHWVLLNASPDLRQQIAATPALHPRPSGTLRNSPICAVVLSNGDVDAVTGLLSLRERQPFTLYASERILETLRANSIFNVLDPAYVDRVELSLHKTIRLTDHDRDLGLEVEVFPVPGKVALYLEDQAAGPGLGTREGDTIGLAIKHCQTGRRFFYIPSCATVDTALAQRLQDAALVLFDGTLFTDDELITQGLSDKTGRRMGHISISGTEGSLTAFRSLNVARKVYIHLNTSNPALIDDSFERVMIARDGWEVAFDGMEIQL